MAAVHFFYYPKWDQPGAEATLSYDVSGYYLYLPAAFIYDDLREVKFLDEIVAEYHPTAEPYQVFEHESGARVMKYSIGQAVMYAPFFAVAHAWAKADDSFPPDGFSFPYQFMISLGSLAVCFLGLYWLMVLLRQYFPEIIVGLTLVLITVGTNYLNYTAIDGAMTHNNVFTLAALLLLTTHRFHERPGWGRALLIGGCVGLMALTRPTEIIVAVIPLLWGLDLREKGALTERLAFFGRHWPKLLAAAALTLAIGSVQLVYWKYVSGDWLVYSYQDQGFDWLAPHLNQGFFSYKAGWLIYTPLMVFGVLGFYSLWRRLPRLLLALGLHFALFVYVAFAWSVWWYGGSLGQRTMVQEYAVLSFPLAAFLWSVFSFTAASGGGARSRVPGEDSKQPATVGPSPAWVRWTVGVLLVGCIWHNLYFTHQAHRGGLYLTEQMTAAYFWRTLYTFGKDPEDRLRLDTPEFYTAAPDHTDRLFLWNFEDQSTSDCGMDPINGGGSLCLKGEQQSSPDYVLPIDLPPRTWLRATVKAKIDATRGNKDNHTQFIIAFNRNGVEVKRRLIRMHRLLNHDWRRSLQIDSKVPDDGADEVVLRFWNGGNTQPPIVLDDLELVRIYE